MLGIAAWLVDKNPWPTAGYPAPFLRRSYMYCLGTNAAVYPASGEFYETIYTICSKLGGSRASRWHLKKRALKKVQTRQADV